MRWIAAALLAVLIAGCAGGLGTAPGVSRAVRDEPVSPAIQKHYNDALALIRSDRLSDAERALVHLTRTNPGLSGPYGNLGIVYFRTNRTSEAIDALNRATTLNPRPVYFNQLGIIFRHQGEFEKAREQYAKALSVDGSYAPAHLNIGILYDLYLGDRSRALEHYRRYQELLPAKDDEVSKWIFDLERQLKRANAPQGRKDS